MLNAAYAVPFWKRTLRRRAGVPTRVGFGATAPDAAWDVIDAVNEYREDTEERE